jgi:hypothetical protein
MPIAVSKMTVVENENALGKRLICLGGVCLIVGG